MNKKEFEGKLNDLKNGSRPTVYAFFSLMLLVAIASLSWAFYFKQFFNRAEFFIISFALLVIFFIVFFALFFKTRSNLKRYAPHCPFCDNPISWQERDQVLTTSVCPKCSRRVIEY